MSHTLKSNAGQIRKTALQSATADIEASLKHGMNSVTEKQLNAFEKELNKVLEEVCALIDNSSAAPQSGESLNAKDTSDLFDNLIPLLKDGNPESADYIEKIRRIPDNGAADRRGSLKMQLIQQIEEYEFDNAFNSVNELKKLI